MKLYLLINLDFDPGHAWDTYDSAVVCAVSEEKARQMHPSGKPVVWGMQYATWAKGADRVRVLLLGDACEGCDAGVLCASFNAG